MGVDEPNKLGRGRRIGYNKRPRALRSRGGACKGRGSRSLRRIWLGYSCIKDIVNQPGTSELKY